MGKASPNYDGRCFVPISNSDNGTVTGETRFHYHQNGDVVWAHYEGGGVAHGHLVGRVTSEGKLVHRYHHLPDEGDAASGICVSTLTILADGRYRLEESWRWTSGDQTSGRSVVEEIPDVSNTEKV